MAAEKTRRRGVIAKVVDIGSKLRVSTRERQIVRFVTALSGLTGYGPAFWKMLRGQPEAAELHIIGHRIGMFLLHSFMTGTPTGEDAHVLKRINELLTYSESKSPKREEATHRARLIIDECAPKAIAAGSVSPALADDDGITRREEIVREMLDRLALVVDPALHAVRNAPEERAKVVAWVERWVAARPLEGQITSLRLLAELTYEYELRAFRRKATPLGIIVGDTEESRRKKAIDDLMGAFDSQIANLRKQPPE